MCANDAVQSIGDQAEDVLKVLDEIAPRPKQEVKGPLEHFADRWTKRLFIGVAAVVGILFLAAGVQRLTALPNVVLEAAFGLGWLLWLAGIALVLLNLLSGAVAVASEYRRFGDDCRRQLRGHYADASRLVHFSPAALEAADNWLEQKVKRMERRFVRFFGGSDKLAVAAIAAAGWSIWKDTGAKVLSLHMSPLFFGFAFLFGLAIGGMVSVQLADRLVYQRDLLQTAKSLKLSR